MPELNERMATAEAQIQAIVEARADRDREMKALKAELGAANGKLDVLLSDKERRDGALGLGRWLIGIGLPTLVGGFILELWHFFDGKH